MFDRGGYHKCFSRIRHSRGVHALWLASFPSVPAAVTGRGVDRFGESVRADDAGASLATPHIPDQSSEQG